MSTLPCLYCDGPIPASEAERASLCPLCSRPLTVCGRYRLKQLLSKSESDRVYSAADDKNEVAVKVVLARDDDWATISEFERMARTLQSLKSRAVPQIFGWEKGGLGRLIVVREKLHGHTLEDRVRGGQRASPASAAKMLEDLLSLLSDLHRLTPPLLHRDIRPSNILFRDAGTWSPVLVDFDPRAGSATVATDLAALGKTIQFSGGSGPIVDKLIDGRLASAADALNALRQSGNREPQPRVHPANPPADPKQQPKLWVMMALGLFFAIGLISSLTRHKKRDSSPPIPTGSEESKAKRFARECESGNATSCYYLGFRYEKGNGVVKSDVEAAKVYDKSCTLGEMSGCNNLGVLYETGRGVPKNGVRAAALYGQACDQSDWLACRNEGYLYSNGIGVAQDGAKAVELYTKACNHGEIKACYNLGWVYDHGKGVPADVTRAMELYLQACDGKDWVGCTGAGWLFENGRGVPANITRARALYVKGCDNDEATACNNLGAMYAKGNGVGKDDQRAFTLYGKACNGGDHYGCCNLGFYYEKGLQTEKDLDRATGLYQKSCMLGYDKCCNNFLDMLKGSTHDTALALMKQACDEGNQWNCDQLARSK